MSATQPLISSRRSAPSDSRAQNPNSDRFVFSDLHRYANRSHRLPRLERERDTINRLDDAVLGPEMRLEVAYFEHRHCFYPTASREKVAAVFLKASPLVVGPGIQGFADAVAE